jgi:hypothetical protein
VVGVKPVRVGEATALWELLRGHAVVARSYEDVLAVAGASG